MVRLIRLATLIALAIGFSRSWAAWDDPPVVNTIQATTGVVGLNFGMPGDKQQIAMFVVNSNDPDGFHVEFTFANKGLFKSGTRTFPMSNVVLSKVAGTLGSGLADPNETALAIDAGSGIATWDNLGTPGSATENYVIAIYADWSDQSALLAGFYQENITAVVVSGH